VDNLFVSLWRSNLDEEGRLLGDCSESPPEDYAEILNKPSNEKLAGYAWLTDRFESLGPIRCPGEFDSFP
jgi:hypothetical protein